MRAAIIGESDNATNAEITTDPAVKLQALSHGAMDFLSKPVDPSELALRIRNTLGATAYRDFLAHHDPLTSLPNQLRYRTTLAEVMQTARAGGHRGAVLHVGMDRRVWLSAFEQAYEGFCDALERGRDTWLDPYAAEHLSEFFAVLSEAFFREPAETRRRYPDVYDQLKLFYRQDPEES